MLKDELEQQIRLRGEDAAARFQEASGGALDFSEASVAAVEQLVSEISEFAADVDPGQLEGLVQDFGCYLFEVARRGFGGKYYWLQDEGQPALFVGAPGSGIGVAFFSRVRARLRGELAEPVSTFFSGFADRVRAAGPDDETLLL